MRQSNGTGPATPLRVPQNTKNTEQPTSPGEQPASCACLAELENHVKQSVGRSPSNSPKMVQSGEQVSLARLSALEDQVNHLIAKYEEEESSAVAKMKGRVAGVENSLRELTTNFLRYQEDLASILTKEFVRLKEQMQQQEVEFQGNVHKWTSSMSTLTSEAISSGKERLMSEINTEWDRMKTFIRSSEKSMDEASTLETASTASVLSSECTSVFPHLDTHEKVMKIIAEVQDVRNDIDVLRVNQNATEERFVALEKGGTGLARAESEEFRSPNSRTKMPFDIELDRLVNALHMVLNPAEKSGVTVPSVPSQPPPIQVSSPKRFISSLGPRDIRWAQAQSPVQVPVQQSSRQAVYPSPSQQSRV